MEDIHALRAALQDEQLLLAMTREVMEYVCESRARWIASHENDFPTARSKKEYMTAWVLVGTAV